MRTIREIDVGGLKIQVREMTVAEIRRWIKDVAAAPGADAIDAALFADLALSELAYMTSLTDEEIAELTPNEIAQVIEVAQEVNARFFEMRARLVDLGRAVQPIPS